MSERDPIAALASLVAEEAWLVGGTVRDELLGRPTTDFDLAVREPPQGLARRLAQSTRGHAFELSESFGGWRVVARDRRWQVDLLPLAGGSIERDLAARDLTVNAMARPLGEQTLLDPHGGQADLAARRLRMVAPGAFSADPLRTLRLARLAAQLGFTVEPDTAGAARAVAAGLEGVAPERIFAELCGILVSEQALAGLAAMERLGVTGVVLPELAALRDVEQSRFHHLDVHDHTLEVLEETIALTEAPEGLFGDLAPALRAVLDEPLANELSRGQALRFGALLHDIAKPQTRRAFGGRVGFPGHDELGTEVAIGILRRLRASERLATFVGELVRHHLRLGFLVREMPLGRRAVYRYLCACEPVEVEVTLLSVADRRATRGEGEEGAIARHTELARQLLGEALAWRRDPPRAPVRGDRLARALGLEPGPELGRLLAALREAAFAGEVQGPEQALEHARTLQRSRGLER